MQRRVTIQKDFELYISTNRSKYFKINDEFRILMELYYQKCIFVILKHWTIFLLAPYANLGVWVINLSHKTTQKKNKKAGKNF